VDLADRSLVGVEALVRWQHPGRGLVPPGEFIPVAEEIGVIGEIGAWVLAESCRQMAAWQVDGLLVPRVAVNLSPLQLDRADLAATVQAALDAAGIGPERVELEVTESTIMRQSATASTVLQELRALGIELALDDFGTGHSSLAQLRRLPLRRLKIDISFVRDIGSDPAAEAIIRAIIAMAGSLGLQTVAEGVEEENQATFLRDAGCDIGQGYLFGRPVPADALLAAWR
jgi:EAL domain-containing protein (putative c-di-GMP-specific phosphodiesterase class I)